MDAITQKRGLETRTATVTADGVDFRASTPLASQAWSVPFENILTSPVEFTEQNGTVPIIESVFIALGLIFIFIGIRSEEIAPQSASIAFGLVCVAFGAGLWIWKRIPRRQIVQLSTGEFPLVLFYEARHRPDVDAFTATVIEACKKYLRDSYSAGNGYESKANQLERLEALRDRGSLSEEEFDSLKAELVGKTPGLEASGQYI